jgi:hypothetical protein
MQLIKSRLIFIELKGNLSNINEISCYLGNHALDKPEIEHGIFYIARNKQY